MKRTIMAAVLAAFAASSYGGDNYRYDAGERDSSNVQLGEAGERDSSDIQLGSAAW